MSANIAGHKHDASFERLIVRAERAQLDFDGLRELARAYRAQTARLSVLKTRTSDPEVIRYLNGLCLRAHVHLRPPVPVAKPSGGFWYAELPAVLGRTLRLQLLAAGLLLLGTALGARLVAEDPRNLAATVSAQLYSAATLEQLYASEQARVEFLRRRAPALGKNTLFAGSLFAHNTRIGMLSLASGILGALPSVLLLLYNGLTLGGFAAIFMRGATRMPFLYWIVPHAIPELLAVVLCSVGGIALGLAALSPGRAGRAAALRAAGRDALLLLMAAVPLFVLAALIESFVRESQLGDGARQLVAVLACAGLLGYGASLRWYSRRKRGSDLDFLAASLTAARPRGSRGSDRAAAR